MDTASQDVTTAGSTDKVERRTPKPPPLIQVKVSWCKGCGLCVAYCNRGVLEMNGALPKVVLAERCTRCLQCEAICPDFAIQVGDEVREAGAVPAGSAVT